MHASSDASDKLHLTLFSQAEWLSHAFSRISTYAQGGGAGAATASMASLIGLGRVVKGLQVLEPAVGRQPKYAVVTDVSTFLEFFLDSTCGEEQPQEQVANGHSGDLGLDTCAGQQLQLPERRVRWSGSAPLSTNVRPADMEAARAVFRANCCFEELSSFVDFLRDFRVGSAVAQAKPQPRPPRLPSSASNADAESVRSRSLPAASVARSVRSTTQRKRSHTPPPKRPPSEVHRRGGRGGQTQSRSRSSTLSHSRSRSRHSRRQTRRRSRSRSTPPLRRSPSYRRQ